MSAFTKEERERAMKHFGLDEDGCNDQDLLELLDESVHDAKGAEAANINNSGVKAQLEYLGVD